MLKYCFIILFFFLGMPKHQHYHQINDTAIDIEIFKLERKIESMNAEAWMLITEIKKE